MERVIPSVVLQLTLAIASSTPACSLAPKKVIWKFCALEKKDNEIFAHGLFVNRYSGVLSTIKIELFGVEDTFRYTLQTRFPTHWVPLGGLIWPAHPSLFDCTYSTGHSRPFVDSGNVKNRGTRSSRLPVVYSIFVECASRTSHTQREPAQPPNTP
jgi:hypothetical protein